LDCFALEILARDVVEGTEVANDPAKSDEILQRGARPKTVESECGNESEPWVVVESNERTGEVYERTA
jgi:hypothetical protein